MVFNHSIAPRHTHPGRGLEIEMQRKHFTMQWWDRRGCMVYGEDYGPGTAELILTAGSADEAQRIVDQHNAALENSAVSA